MTTIDTPTFNQRIIARHPGLFAAQVSLRLIYLVLAIVPGLIAKAVLDTISGDQPAQFGVWALIGLYLAVELGRLSVMVAETWVGSTFRMVLDSFLRHNILAAILHRPGAEPQPVAPGDAVDRFANDVTEVSDFPTWLPEVAGELLGMVIAITIMARIDAGVTLWVLLPMLVVIGVYRLVWNRLHHYAHTTRLASGAVAGFLSEVLGAVQAVKVANAANDITSYYDRLNTERARAAIREQGFRALLNGIYGQTTAIATGLFLLLIGQNMASGAFTVGEFALFVTYLSYVAGIPMTLGTFIGDYQQQAVAIGRLSELVAPADPRVLVAPSQAVATPILPPATDNTTLLDIRDLTYHYPTSGGGVSAINLRIAPGTMTVITGRIGSGKTTLLRALLGLLPGQSMMHWRGQPIDDPANFFQPPYTAYTPQVPRLFSETLRENLLLGMECSEADVAIALQHAVFTSDVATFTAGLDTTVGPRGVRLSGGQVQRAATARMLVRRPDLLVFDDVSSALDVETERALWEQLRQPDNSQTILAVSHRRAALQQADQIIVLKEGQIEAQGHWSDLLEHSAEFRQIWYGGEQVKYTNGTRGEYEEWHDER